MNGGGSGQQCVDFETRLVHGGGTGLDVRGGGLTMVQEKGVGESIRNFQFQLEPNSCIVDGRSKPNSLAVVNVICTDEELK